MDKEAIARIVHGAMRWAADNSCTDKHPEWQGGNSFAEDEARKAATDILATLSPAEPSPESREGVEYVIWSNEHRSWWAPNRCGYTSSLERAGRYDRAEAISIAHSARGGWNMAKQAERNPPEIAMPLADALAQDAKAPAHD